MLGDRHGAHGSSPLRPSPLAHRARLSWLSLPLALAVATSLLAALGFTAALAGTFTRTQPVPPAAAEAHPPVAPKLPAKAELREPTDHLTPPPEAPAPRREPTRAGPPMRLSPMRLGARLELGLDQLEALVNRAAPGPLVADSKGWRGDQKYKVYRGAIKLRRRGQEIEWSMPLRIEAAGRTRVISTITRACRAAARITMRSQLSVDKNWEIRSKTRPTGHDWQKRCKVELIRGLSLDLTPTLSAQLTRIQKKIAARIDRELKARLPLRKQAETAWRSLQANQNLADGLTLQLRPDRVTASAIEVRNDRLRMQLEVRAKPRVYWNHAPKPVKPRSLPQLMKVKNPHARIDGRIELIVPLNAIAVTARRHLERSGWGHVARGLRLRGLGRRVELSVLPGGANPLRMTAQPRWDADTGAIYLAGVESSMATNTPRPTFLSGQNLLQGLAGRLRYQPRSELAQAESQLTNHINFQQRSGALTLRGRGQVEKFAIERVAMGPRGLHMALRLKANWTIALTAS